MSSTWYHHVNSSIVNFLFLGASRRGLSIGGERGNNHSFEINAKYGRLVSET